jgi:hypothetical protein
MRRRVLVLAVAAAALAAAGCTAAPPEETAPPPTPLPTLRTPTRSVGPTDAPETALPPTPDPESTYQQLMAAIPEPIKARCARGEPGRGALARVSCRPSGVDEALYELFDGEAAMRQAFRSRVEALPAGSTAGPGCARGTGEERLPVGRRVCHREGGAAVTAWTNDLAFVIVTARRDDGDFAALDRFFRAAGPITP